ncbi:hypothetical protein HDA32_001530 [Spinactinospora alkalitolerans]|uniref:DUF3558 domain-containing protein n=1 Tax=Spinactinospora alkalitolerans TaxID=687207 RepID=A0A852TX24_9ACTN|nr:hypothetical protein [Spinactinospora alkalitolerans]NYE46410.1 hypothetical protein [Spinactinospora alkalitolerans]
MAQPPYGGPPPGPSGGPPGPPGPPGPQGPARPTGFGPSPVPADADPYLGEAPKSRRGCAIAALVSLVIAVLLLGGGGVGTFVWLNGDGGDFDAAPDCSAGEGEALARLVTDYEADLDERIDTREQQWWEGRQCHWTTTAATSGLPASASLVFIRNGNRLGVGGEAEAEADLDREVGSSPATPLSGLGDEAVAWYDDQNLLGCVGVRMSNLFISTCYEAATNYSGTEPVTEEEAKTGAEDFAREVVDTIGAGA